jgi:chromosome segregation ATPase
MENDKYINYYIDILASTLNDALLRNISLQANERISKEVIETYEFQLKNFDEELQTLKTNKNNFETQEIKSLKDAVSELTKKLEAIKDKESEYDKTKHQVEHIKTFRSELTKAQKIIEEKDEAIAKLNKQIEYLQLTPAQRRKVDASKVKESVEEASINKENTKDGGSF